MIIEAQTPQNKKLGEIILRSLKDGDFRIIEITETASGFYKVKASNNPEDYKKGNYD